MTLQSSFISKNGKKIILNRGYKGSPDYTPVSKFSVGTNQTTNLTEDSSSLSETVPINNTVQLDSCDDSSTFSYYGESTAPSTDNTLGNYLEGTGCVDLGKSGVASKSFSYSTVVTPQTFSSGKKIYAWIYISNINVLDVSAALTLGFGQDTTNYYKVTKTRANLSNGWNYVILDRSTASSEGAPIDAACDTIMLLFNSDNAATTISSGNIRVDNIFLTNTDSFIKSFDLGFPVIDEINNEVTVYVTLETSEAIGFELNAASYENTDTTPLVGGFDSYRGNSKSKDDSFVYIIKDRIE